MRCLKLRGLHGACMFGCATCNSPSSQAQLGPFAPGGWDRFVAVQLCKPATNLPLGRKRQPLEYRSSGTNCIGKAPQILELPVHYSILCALPYVINALSLEVIVPSSRITDEVGSSLKNYFHKFTRFPTLTDETTAMHSTRGDAP